MTTITEEQKQYLYDHKWAVLATGRKDGSPQISQIAYDFNGADIVISIKSFTAKWKNAVRQPKIALLVHDDRKQLIIYGAAECIGEDHAERNSLTLRVFKKLTGDDEMELSDEFAGTLNDQQRTVLRIKPDKVMMNE